MNGEVWTTRVVTVETPRGPRYQGVCYVGEGRPTAGNLPRGAQVRYRTRLHTQANEACEQARSRTIHHNIWHDGTTPLHVMALHSWSDCPERRLELAAMRAQAEEDAELDEAHEYGFSFMVQS